MFEKFKKEIDSLISKENTKINEYYTIWITYLKVK